MEKREAVDKKQCPDEYYEPVLVDGTEAYLVAPFDVVPVCRDALIPEVGVNAMCSFTPPDLVNCAYVMTNADFKLRQRCVETFRRYGYPNVESVDNLSVRLASNIWKLPLKCAIGEPVLVFVEDRWDLWHWNVIEKCENGWKIIGRYQHFTQAKENHPFVRNIVYDSRHTEISETSLKALFPGGTFHLASQEPDVYFPFDFINNRIRKGNFDGYEVLPYFDFDIFCQFEGKTVQFPMADRVPPFTIEQFVDVGDSLEVKIYVVTPADRFEKELPSIVKTFNFDRPASRTVLITITVDKTLLPIATYKTLTLRRFDVQEDPFIPNVLCPCGEPVDVIHYQSSHDDAVDDNTSNSTLPEQLSQLELGPPTTILTFTSDNRVLVETDKTYTGATQHLAYVRLEAWKVPQVGKRAFEALKTHPDSVYYDITRLLATDFDPDYPHPMWGFKTTRGADGKVVIHDGGEIEMQPIFLFGLIVNSMRLYINEHLESNVTHLGIRLPTGSVVSEDDLNMLSQRNGVKLTLLNW